MAEPDSYASGRWAVQSGREDEFIERWREFLEWTRDNAEGFQGATLVRNQQMTDRFISYAQWDSDEAMAKWRELPEFQEKIRACSELCKVQPKQPMR